MTPKEKACELIDSYMDIGEEQEYNTPRYLSEEVARKCALIAVDEIIKNIVSSPTDYGASWTYWMQVKQEINKL